MLLHIRDCFIRPRFVHKADIALLAGRLTATHGPRAEEQAAIEEDYCWRRGDVLQQAVWKRVRQESRREAEGGRDLWLAPRFQHAEIPK